MRRLKFAAKPTYAESGDMKVPELTRIWDATDEHKPHRNIQIAKQENCRHPVVGGDTQERTLELITGTDIHRNKVIRELRFLTENRNFPTIGCRPVIEINRLLRLGRGLSFTCRFLALRFGCCGAG